MQRTLNKDLKTKTGEEAGISGWVDVRRDQGKMVFLDIRDFSGKVQTVVLPNSEAMEVAKTLRPEWVVEVLGKVNERPEKNRNVGEENGNIELEVISVTFLNEA